jgi:hypothetical protein
MIIEFVLFWIRQKFFNKAKEYGDDKVQLAIQTYELVDKHIRRLDSDLARFESEIKNGSTGAASSADAEASTPSTATKSTIWLYYVVKS